MHVRAQVHNFDSAGFRGFTTSVQEPTLHGAPEFMEDTPRTNYMLGKRQIHSEFESPFVPRECWTTTFFVPCLFEPVLYDLPEV